MKWKTVLAGAILTVAAVSLTACGSSSSKNSLQKIQDKGTITVALNPEFAPFEFQTLVDGKNKVVGSDIDLANAIGKELGVKVKISTMSFSNVLSSLQSGKADIAISGISATKERKKVYDFSIPYYQVKDEVIVKKSNLDKYTKTSSFKNLKVGAQKGTIQEQVVQDQLTGSNLVSLEKNGEMINELKSGQLQGVVLEAPIAKGYVDNNSDLAIADITLKSSSQDSYAIAMPKGSTALKKKIDKVIKEEKKSGNIEKNITKAYELSQK